MNRKLRAFALLLLTALALPASLCAQQRELTGTGCVESAVDQQCVLLRDLSSGALYSLHMNGPGPSAGEAIEFTATTQQGINGCLQGQPVAVTRWVRSQVLRCAPGGAGGQQASAQPAPNSTRTLQNYSFR